jgi:hypothetical protein
MIKINIPKQYLEPLKILEINSVSLKFSIGFVILSKGLEKYNEKVFESYGGFIDLLEKEHIIYSIFPDEWIEPYIHEQVVDEAKEILDDLMEIKEDQVMEVVTSSGSFFFYKDKDSILEATKINSKGRVDIYERFSFLIKEFGFLGYRIFYKDLALEKISIYFYYDSAWKTIENASSRAGLTGFISEEELTILKENYKPSYVFIKQELSSYRVFKN